LKFGKSTEILIFKFLQMHDFYFHCFFESRLYHHRLCELSAFNCTAKCNFLVLLLNVMCVGVRIDRCSYLDIQRTGGPVLIIQLRNKLHLVYSSADVSSGILYSRQVRPGIRLFYISCPHLYYVTSTVPRYQSIPSI